MPETRVPALDREELLEKEMPAHSSVLAWGIPGTEEPGELHPSGHREADTTQ